jgi:hypothetical protein
MIEGDKSFACPARRSARWLAAAGAGVFLYHFVRLNASLPRFIFVASRSCASPSLL